MSEHVIPFAQLEPLLRPGMTGRELKHAILDRAGLPHERYSILIAARSSLAECIADGVVIVTRAEAERLDIRDRSEDRL